MKYLSEPITGFNYQNSQLFLGRVRHIYFVKIFEEGLVVCGEPYRVPFPKN
jgi:hypothetical protein